MQNITAFAIWGALAGASLLSAAIWQFSPLLGAPFDSIWLRAILVTIPLLLWALVWFLASRHLKKRKAGVLKSAVVLGPEARKAEAAAREEAELRLKIDETLAKLKASSGHKPSYFLSLPRYALIGPPGSGKSAALRNSGLEFLLAKDQTGPEGSTAFFDLWINESAVLIDTAGRYTIQDSNHDDDEVGWDAFLQMLKALAPIKPLNGVIVTFGADMISCLDSGQREAQARNIRRRLKEMESRLGQRVPVYWLVTKADLLPGFTEFFDDLDRPAREQVWGFTLGLQEGLEKFTTEFRALSERLVARIMDRLQNERDPARRASIAGFPGQFATIEAPLKDFAEAAFGGSRLDPAPLLRGVYFISATQEGAPLDRLAGAMARNFGLSAASPSPSMAQNGKPYFLNRLLKTVLFNEAGLAANDRRLELRSHLRTGGAYAAAIALLLFGFSRGWTAMDTETIRNERLTTAVATAEQAGTAQRLDRVQSPELSPVLPYLDAALALPAAAAGRAPVMLSQQGFLGAGATTTYQRVLNQVMLPRLLRRLEGEIRRSIQRPDYIYEALRIYLMLGNKGPLDRDMIQEWFTLEWQQSYPGALNSAKREALGRHLEALLARPLQTYELDDTLLDAARTILSRMPMARRVYSRLRHVADNTPDWLPSDAMGQVGQRLFTRASGRLWNMGVPGFFTVEGLHSGVLPRLPQAAQEAANEAWVLGHTATASAADPVRLEAEVLALYAEDYIRAWEVMIGDIVLPPFGRLTAVTEALSMLGAPDSPIKELLSSITHQLSPGAAPAETTATDRVAAAVGVTTSSAAQVAAAVEQHFKPLREAAGQPLDGVMAIINDLYAQVSRQANAPPGAGSGPTTEADVSQRLMAEAQRQPPPLRAWLTVIAQSAGRGRATGARAAMAAAAAGDGSGGVGLNQLCHNIEEQFPFNRSPGAPDMPADDFIRLFAPGGLFDQFFTQHIRPFADTTQRPWVPVSAPGLPPPISAAELAQFERAAAIRAAFFPAGAASGFRFRLISQGLQTGVAAAILEAAGARTMLSGEAGRPIDLAFPALHPISLHFDPVSDQGELIYQGEWSSLKMILLHRLEPTAAPDRFRLTVEHGNRRAEFVVQATSRLNPFGLSEMSQFRCPNFAPQPQ
jgi:type VI secretion system protein ImpL